MNEIQTIFTVFYAIFWGHIASVLPRWKAFHFVFIFRIEQTAWRASLSLFLLNFFPFGFFSITYVLLYYVNIKINNFNREIILSIIFYSIFPCFFNFGCYHLWIGIIERFWRFFYVNDEEQLPKEARSFYDSKEIIEPTRRHLSIKNGLWENNIIIGIIYIILSSIPLIDILYNQDIILFHSFVFIYLIYFLIIVYYFYKKFLRNNNI